MKIFHDQRKIWFQARMKSVLCLCMCGVSLAVTSQIHSDAITTHWVFVIPIMGRKHLTDCNADWEIKAEVNEELALGLQQFINLPPVMHPFSACSQQIPPHTHTHPSFKCIKLFVFSFEPERDYTHWLSLTDQPCMMLIMKLQRVTFLYCKELVLSTRMWKVNWKSSMFGGLTVSWHHC